ncbi:AAA family ATPase [Acetobacterium fimetarium]|uniref:AAA family ATPase n=1 Tax=Acetobacterium fimetarium TaxID=52691 RepID=A0ABR6WR50_9FIRM|nr:ATP-binding protein [Acetobacterium fimetarium]MBC3802988.1 AAA family ATPase [Acetobacterium fimetarium]
MFVGRKRELKKLEEMYQSGQFECAVFYGRRRVGKTTLIDHFCQGKKTIYFTATEGTAKDNLAAMSRAILSVTSPGLPLPAFESFADLLNYLDSACEKERMILVIDEYPYLAESYPAISSMLQAHIDHIWKNSPLFLILCGSSMSFMEHQVLGYKSPLYGRRTAQFKIHPFTYFESREMLGGFDREDQAVLYGVTGGFPEYLSRIDAKKKLEDNLIDLFFEESGRLFEEPVNLLKQELREPASYHSVISAIAGGASRLNEIATKTGLETSGCSSLLSSLIELGIVRKEIPVTEVRSKKTLYRLEDSMFTFWYRFVRPNISGISRGIGAVIFENQVQAQLNHFMGNVFEAICKQYLYLPEIYEKAPFAYGEVGRWWGNNPREKRQEEIDLMAFHEDQALFCECKWQNEPVKMNVVTTLKRRGELFHFSQKHFIVFSKSGFAENVEKECRDEGIELIDFQKMTASQGVSELPGFQK